MYYVPTFGTKVEVRQTRVRSRSDEDLRAKSHWNFRWNLKLGGVELPAALTTPLLEVHNDGLFLMQ